MKELGKYNCSVCGENLPPTQPRRIDHATGEQRHYDAHYCMFALRRRLEAARPTTAVRRFTVYRTGDLSETHTPQQVNPPAEPQFEGVVFSDGTCVLRWRTAFKSTSVWASLEEALGVHGHFEARYGTYLVWHDPEVQ